MSHLLFLILLKLYLSPQPHTLLLLPWRPVAEPCHFVWVTFCWWEQRLEYDGIKAGGSEDKSFFFFTRRGIISYTALCVCSTRAHGQTQMPLPLTDFPIQSNFSREKLRNPCHTERISGNETPSGVANMGLLFLFPGFWLSRHILFKRDWGQQENGPLQQSGDCRVSYYSNSGSKILGCFFVAVTVVHTRKAFPGWPLVYTSISYW